MVWDPSSRYLHTVRTIARHENLFGGGPETQIPDPGSPQQTQTQQPKRRISDLPPSPEAIGSHRAVREVDRDLAVRKPSPWTRLASSISRGIVGISARGIYAVIARVGASLNAALELFFSLSPFMPLLTDELTDVCHGHDHGHLP